MVDEIQPKNISVSGVTLLGLRVYSFTFQKKESWGFFHNNPSYLGASGILVFTVSPEI
jgi:hypothetical protein